MERCVSRKRVCSYCMKEVAHTSFYRHLNDKTGVVCPGKCSQLVSYTPNDKARSIYDETGITPVQSQ